MKIIFSALFLSLLLSCSLALAQDDSTQQKKDSAHSVLLNNEWRKVQQLSAKLEADYTKRIDLQKQVSLLSATDNVKRAALLQELAALKQRDSLYMAKQKHQVDSLRKTVKGFGVVPFRDTLFYVYTRQGSFTAKDRADAITNRIIKLTDDYTFRADSLKLAPAEQTMDILFKNNLLVSVSDKDALWQNTSKELLAAQIKGIIGKAVVEYRHETSWSVLLRGGAIAFGVILFVIFIIYVINRAFKLLLTKTSTQTSWYSNGVRIRDYELLNSGQEIGFFHAVIRLVKWVLIILVIYLALPVLFGIFPFTENLSDLLLGYVTSPLKKVGISVWNYIPNLMTILVLVVIFRYVLKFFKYLKTEIAAGKLTIPGFYHDWANPTYQILRVLILAFMLVVIFPYMPGSDSQIFKGVSVFIGVLFTFGSAGALGNVVAGLVLTYMRAFKLGDRVKIGEVSGDIIERSLLVTRIRTVHNEIISIPNSTVMSNHTVNYSSDAPINGLIVHTNITIGYDASWRQVHQLLIDAALDTPLIEKEPKPFVLQTSLDDDYVSYQINAYTKQANQQALIYSDLHSSIQDNFNKAGVEIMSPHHRTLRDGNATTIPAEYLPKDDEGPVFNTKEK